jgi:hypothetical protein
MEKLVVGSTTIERHQRPIAKREREEKINYLE